MSKNTNAATVETTVETTATTPEVAKHDVKALMVQLKTKSAVIRHLSGLGLKVGAINKAFEVAGVKMRYQHVRNVLITPVKKTA